MPEGICFNASHNTLVANHNPTIFMSDKEYKLIHYVPWDSCGPQPGVAFSCLRRSSMFIRSAMQSQYAVGVCQLCPLKKKSSKKNMHSTHRVVITIVKPKVQQ